MFGITCSGDPKVVVPYLEETVKKAEGFVSRNKDFDLQEAVAYLLHTDAQSDGRWLVVGGMGDCVDYTYSIGKDGAIAVRGIGA